MITAINLLIQRHPNEERDVLLAYISAKKNLVDMKLPVIPSGERMGQVIAEHALRLGLLETFTAEEIRVYQTLLSRMHFMIRSPATIARLARVNLKDVGRAIGKLKSVALLGCQFRLLSLSVYAFTDASRLSSEQVVWMKKAINAVTYEDRCS